MANDSMRGGPRGSSDQASLLEPITVQLSTFGGVTTVIDESSAAQFIAWSPLPGGNEAGYKVERIFIVTTEVYGDEGENFIIGTYTKATNGSFVAVDDDAFVTAIKFANATPLGTTTVLTLTGAGAGLDPLADGNANFLIGGPSNHYLGLSKVSATSGGTGAYVCYADLVPVSGSKFSD
jgi:hypothetical protein